MDAKTNKVLNYVIYNPRNDITLDLYEAELYAPAVIVQSLIGNLVYYSNFGRYEPRIARSWERVNPTTWKFQIEPGHVLANGEIISGQTFKLSLERTIRYLARKQTVPVLSKLKGFDEFVAGGNDLLGITATQNSLTLQFSEPLRDGVLQVLSFAPFGYISKDNLKEDGSWKDNKAFISSGPYEVESIDIGKKYVLRKRRGWNRKFAKGAPDTIVFTHALPASIDPRDAWIFDSATTSAEAPPELDNFDLVPEYMAAIVLSGKPNGFFSDIRNRNWIKQLVNIQKAKDTWSWGNRTRSHYFYPNQSAGTTATAEQNYSSSPPLEPLIIEGSIPPVGSSRALTWEILKASLESARIPYRFGNNQTSMKTIGDSDYDIRMIATSVGGGAEAWGLEIIFYSDLGPRLPDPGGKIRNLIKRFELGEINELSFSEQFNRAVEEDAAIIPVSHYGVNLKVSPAINRDSIKPTLSIIRFDELELNLD